MVAAFLTFRLELFHFQNQAPPSNDRNTHLLIALNITKLAGKGRLTQRAVQRAGLGLSICARLSEMMGANLRVVSEPGLGSSFSLNTRLPVVAGSLAHSADIDLQGISVFVRAPLKDLAQSLIDWLTRWEIGRAHV